MLQSTQASRLGLSGAAKQVQLYSAGRCQLHPEFSFEWHHTVTAVLASTHLPVIMHTSDCSWTSRHCRIMNRVRPVWKNSPWKSVQHMVSWICVHLVSVSLCLFSFNTSCPNSELACKSVHVCLLVCELLDYAALAVLEPKVPAHICKTFVFTCME